jgi:hypothetical protein
MNDHGQNGQGRDADAPSAGVAHFGVPRNDFAFFSVTARRVAASQQQGDSQGEPV